MKLSASLYAASPLHLPEQIAKVAPFVSSWHVDIMDGRFAPAFGCNERLVRALPQISGLPIDLHLMVEDPLLLIARLALPHVRLIAFHATEQARAAPIAAAIRAVGIAPYLALRPEIDVSDITPLIPLIDGMLLLTAPAGGGDFSPEAFRKIHATPAGVPVIVDGQIGPDHFPELSAADVALAVVGRTLFEEGDPAVRGRMLSERLCV